jgi:hypothetical protein
MAVDPNPQEHVWSEVRDTVYRDGKQWVVIDAKRCWCEHVHAPRGQGPWGDAVVEWVHA